MPDLAGSVLQGAGGNGGAGALDGNRNLLSARQRGLANSVSKPENPQTSIAGADNQEANYNRMSHQ